MERDHRIPTALVGCGQIFHEARDFQALFRGHIRTPRQHGGKRCCGFRIVILIGARECHDQSARDIMGQPMHVINLRGQQQFSDIAEDRIGHHGT